MTVRKRHGLAAISTGCRTSAISRLSNIRLNRTAARSEVNDTFCPLNTRVVDVFSCPMHTAVIFHRIVALYFVHLRHFVVITAPMQRRVHSHVNLTRNNFLNGNHPTGREIVLRGQNNVRCSCTLTHAHTRMHTFTTYSTLSRFSLSYDLFVDMSDIFRSF